MQIVIGVAKGTDVNLQVMQEFVDSYEAALKDGSIASELKRKTVTVTFDDIPDTDGSGKKDLPINGKTFGANVFIDIDIGENRSDSALIATLLHELTHAYNPNLMYAKGLKDAINYHSPEFYEKVQKDAETLGIPAHHSGTDNPNYQQALIETGRPIVVIERSTSSWANEVSTSINQPQGQTKVIDTPSGPKTVPVTTTVNTPAGPKTVWVDSSYAKTAADNARNAVAAAKTAAAAAQQKENNRDRQGGSSSNDSTTATSSKSSGSSGGTTGGGRSDRDRQGGGTSSGTTTGGRADRDQQGGGTSSGTTTGGRADRDQQGGSTTKKVDSHAGRNGHPIVIDLDSDGVELSTLGGSTARFDFDNDGFKELTSWAGKDDGLLVYDLGGDGKVSEAKEIAFADWTADATDAFKTVRVVYFKTPVNRLHMAAA